MLLQRLRPCSRRGQRQRRSCGRIAMISTVSIDTRTPKWRWPREGRTVFVIARRLSTVRSRRDRSARPWPHHRRGYTLIARRAVPPATTQAPMRLWAELLLLRSCLLLSVSFVVIIQRMRGRLSHAVASHGLRMASESAGHDAFTQGAPRGSPNHGEKSIAGILMPVSRRFGVFRSGWSGIEIGKA